MSASSRPRVIGITGTIGAGKSVVGEMIKQSGYLVFDTDQLVHQLFASDSHLQRAVADRFGGDVLDEFGGIDRTKLGALVFDDGQARKDLEAIVHPAVLRRCDELVEQNANAKVIFFLVPLLFEAGVQSRYDEVWTVYCKPDVLMQRLRARTNLPEEELRKRIDSQLPQEEKCARANLVIDNSGTLEQTRAQLESFIARDVGMSG